MTKYLAVIFGLILFAIPAMAQIYNDKEQVVKAPLDQAVREANAYYSGVPIAGAEEDIMPQKERYNKMTNPLNEANERHFGSLVNAIQ